MYGLPDRLRPLSAAEEQVMLAVWDHLYKPTLGGVENTIKLVYKLTVLSVLASHPKLRVSNILILSIAFVLRIAKQAMHTR